MNTSDILDIKGVKTIVNKYRQKKVHATKNPKLKELRESQSHDRILEEDYRTLEDIERSSARFQTKIMRRNKVQKEIQRQVQNKVKKQHIDAYPFSPLLKMSEREEEINFSRGGWTNSVEPFEDKSGDDSAVSLLEKSRQNSQANL